MSEIDFARRVSTPTVIYADLFEPSSPDLRLAYNGLSELFRDQLGKREYDSLAWRFVSDGMTAHHTAMALPAERPVSVNAGRVLGLMEHFPWLRHVSEHHPEPGQVSARELANMLRCFNVVDWPGLFGINRQEAKALKRETKKLGFDQDKFAAAAREHSPF